MIAVAINLGCVALGVRDEVSRWFVAAYAALSAFRTLGSLLPENNVPDRQIVSSCSLDCIEASQTAEDEEDYQQVVVRVNRVLCDTPELALAAIRDIKRRCTSLTAA